MMRRLTPVLLVGMLVLLGLPQAGQALDPGEAKGMAGKRSVTAATIQKARGTRSNLECTVTAAATEANTKLDCDDPYPNNEPQIAVDPVDPNHMVASSNDYGSCCDEFYTTFDGGATWSTGNMSKEANNRIGSDPVTTFDRATGNVLHSSLNYTVGHAAGTQACDGDVVVSVSTDGGLNWNKPAVVADGVGCDLSKSQLFMDKEWMTTDNNLSSPFYGRTYLTWTGFYSSYGNYLSSPIFEAHSDDGGLTWSAPHVISGSSSTYCTYQESGPADACDEDQFSVPTVAPNGNVYVVFQNEQNHALWETGEVFDDQELVVSSSDGGATWSAPVFVAGLEDGSMDYPTNVDGRQTLSGYQVRVNSSGNIVADPTDPNSGTLYVTFSDNSNGTHDSATPVTNIDVFLTSSTDGGLNWSTPTPVDTSPTDQWFPWADVNPVNGTVGVIFNDGLGSDPSQYDATFAQFLGGVFSLTPVSTEPSHPNESLFFKAGVTGCETCATFHGDYVGLAYGSDGAANLTWTDMRDQDPSLGTGYQQFIYYARVPLP